MVLAMYTTLTDLRLRSSYLKYWNKIFYHYKRILPITILQKITHFVGINVRLTLALFAQGFVPIFLPCSHNVPW